MTAYPVPQSVSTPAPAPTGAPITILRTSHYCRRLRPGRDLSYAVGIVTTYRAGDGPEQRIAHVGYGQTYDAASRAAGSDRHVWLQLRQAGQ